MFKEIKKFILLGTALTVLATNLCSPLMHQGQRASWYLALTSHLHMDYVTHFEKKKMETSLFFKKRHLVVKTGHLTLGCSLSEEENNYSLL